MEPTAQQCCTPSCHRLAASFLTTVPLCKRHAIDVWHAMTDEMSSGERRGDYLVTARQAFVMLPTLKPKTFRVWTFRGRIAPAPETTGEPLYWLGEIEDLLRTAGQQAKTPPHPPIVYYALLSSGRIKIGYTGNLYSRMRDLRVEQPAILAAEPGGRDVERERHIQFATLRHGRTEEFRDTPALRTHIGTIRAEHGAPTLPSGRVVVAAGGRDEAC